MRRGQLLLATVLLVSATACGKKATKEDCQRIVTRITELELKANNITDQRDVESQVAETRTLFKEKAMKQCVGKHISEESLRCIDQAASVATILDECLH